MPKGELETGWQLPDNELNLWRVLEHPTAGRGGLSLPAIVERAIALADADGLAAITMANVASALGYSTMALYRHVPNKSALLLLMLDRALGAPEPASESDSTDWRPRIEALSHQIAVGYRTHSWLLDIPINGPPATPNNLRWLEAGLAALRTVPVPIGTRISIWLVLVIYVRGQAQLQLELERGADAAKASARRARYPAAVSDLITPEAFPELTAALAEGMFDDVEPDDGSADLAFGIGRILDGAEVLIARESLG